MQRSTDSVACFKRVSAFFFFAGQNSACSLNDLMLNMKHVRCMLNPQIAFDMVKNALIRHSSGISSQAGRLAQLFFSHAQIVPADRF